MIKFGIIGQFYIKFQCMTESKEYYENIALKRSILPVLFYLLICFGLFFLIDQISINANQIFGSDRIKLINVLKGIVIGLLTTFLIFYLIFKYKFVEVNAAKNLEVIVKSSPYPVIICSSKDFSINGCSASIAKILGYTSKEIAQVTLLDILTETSYKLLITECQNKNYVNKDFENIHFVEKGNGLLSLSANVLKYELLDKEYLLIRCHSELVTSQLVFEDIDTPNPANVKRPFSF